MIARDPIVIAGTAMSMAPVWPENADRPSQGARSVSSHATVTATVSMPRRIQRSEALSTRPRYGPRRARSRGARGGRVVLNRSGRTRSPTLTFTFPWSIATRPGNLAHTAGPPRRPSQHSQRMTSACAGARLSGSSRGRGPAGQTRERRARCARRPPITMAPPPTAARPATSPPVNGRDDEPDWVAVAASTCVPGSTVLVVVLPPSGYDAAKAAPGASTPTAIAPAASTRTARAVTLLACITSRLLHFPRYAFPRYARSVVTPRPGDNGPIGLYPTLPAKLTRVDPGCGRIAVDRTQSAVTSPASKGAGHHPRTCAPASTHWSDPARHRSPGTRADGSTATSRTPGGRA